MVEYIIIMQPSYAWGGLYLERLVLEKHFATVNYLEMDLLFIMLLYCLTGFAAQSYR